MTYRVNRENDEAHIEDSTKESAIKAAQLLNMADNEKMFGILETKVVKYPGQVITSQFNLDEAISARNSSAKTIYGRLFNWIVGKVNSSIQSKMSELDTGNPDTIHNLGLLDIFGFESLAKNSFE